MLDSAIGLQSVLVENSENALVPFLSSKYLFASFSHKLRKQNLFQVYKTSIWVTIINGKANCLKTPVQ